jgi:hypothetical protein
MRFSAILLVLIVGQLASPRLRAQQAPAAAPKNLVANAGFEASSQRQNLWQGVDSAGFLTGERGQVPVLTLRGEIADPVMPVSVGAVDMNGDGLVDLVTLDVIGYLQSTSTGVTSSSPSSPWGIWGEFFSRGRRQTIPRSDGKRRAHGSLQESLRLR